MTLRESTHRVDMAGLQLVVDEVVNASGTIQTGTGALVPTTAPAANAGTAATSPALTATTGSLPTPDAATVISNTATPTVVELLDAIVELRVTVAALITECATFKTSINAHRTALLATGAYI